jgi:hypothetical protein
VPPDIAEEEVVVVAVKVEKVAAVMADMNDLHRRITHERKEPDIHALAHDHIPPVSIIIIDVLGQEGHIHSMSTMNIRFN